MSVSLATLEAVETMIENTPLSVEAESDGDGTDLRLQWGTWDVCDGDEEDEEVEGKIDREELDNLLSRIFNMIETAHEGFVEEGTSDISEGVYRIRIHDV